MRRSVATDSLIIKHQKEAIKFKTIFKVVSIVRDVVQVVKGIMAAIRIYKTVMA
ncbi:hypothetical protein N826_31245 [Skermanella aerolata KACC 11604]|nr:hypothetical protein N826_31245 [Skermanella aerolata KACC 11604]